MLKVRVRPHERHVRRREPPVHHTIVVPPSGGFGSPVVRRVAADEAYDILRTQDHVIGYETEAQAREVQADLRQRFGLETEVIASVGPPIPEPRGRIEAEELRRMDLEPGARYTRWGVHLKHRKGLREPLSTSGP